MQHLANHFSYIIFLVTAPPHRGEKKEFQAPLEQLGKVWKKRVVRLVRTRSEQPRKTYVGCARQEKSPQPTETLWFFCCTVVSGIGDLKSSCIFAIHVMNDISSDYILSFSVESFYVLQQQSQTKTDATQPPFVLHLLWQTEFLARLFADDFHFGGLQGFVCRRREKKNINVNWMRLHVDLWATIRILAWNWTEWVSRHFLARRMWQRNNIKPGGSGERGNIVRTQCKVKWSERRPSTFTFFFWIIWNHWKKPRFVLTIWTPTDTTQLARGGCKARTCISVCVKMWFVTSEFVIVVVA